MSNHAAYEDLGRGYRGQRQADPRLQAHVQSAVFGGEQPLAVSGGAGLRVLNVGAGTGSYEPSAAGVVALEPAWRMLEQRKRRGNAVRGVAEALPFPSNSFDVVMGVLTLHHWKDLSRGLSECLRVASRRVVLLTWDPSDRGFWLTQDYFPKVLELDHSIFPTMQALRADLPETEVTHLPIPWDCIDGFLCAYWRRPEAYLIPEVRSSMSSLMRIGPLSRGLERLADDLRSGVWRDRHGGVLEQDSLDLGYRLLTAAI